MTVRSVSAAMIFFGLCASIQIQSLMSRAEYIKKNIKVSISPLETLLLADLYLNESKYVSDS